jgi:hypothetical protein
MTCKPGTISPAAKVRILNLPPVSCATRRVRVSEAPKMVSSVLGKLLARRQLMVGIGLCQRGGGDDAGRGA